MRWLSLALFAALLGGCLDDDGAEDDPGGEPPAPTSSVAFLDGAENGTSAWAFTSNVVVIDFTGTAPAQELDRAHPDGTWTVSTTEARNGTSSYYSQYPDNYRARMTTTVDLNGTGVLTYWYKGGAEDNTFDGLYVLVDGTQVAYHTGPAAVADWVLGTASIPSGSHTIEFRFDADPSCSNDSGADTPVQAVCGEGWNTGGFYLDDIQVVA